MESTTQTDPFESIRDCMFPVLESSAKAHERLKADFPQWLTEQDALRMDLRLGVFNLLIRVAHGPIMCSRLASDCMLDPEWWKSSFATHLGSNKSIALSDDFLLFIRYGFIQAFFAAIENSFRSFLFAVATLESFPSNNIGKVYRRLFAITEIQDREEAVALFDIWSEIRNTFHSNGIYNPYSGEDNEIQYKGAKFSFVNGEAIEFAGWNDILTLAQDAIIRFEQLVRTERLSHVDTFITDLHN